MLSLAINGPILPLPPVSPSPSSPLLVVAQFSPLILNCLSHILQLNGRTDNTVKNVVNPRTKRRGPDSFFSFFRSAKAAIKSGSLFNKNKLITNNGNTVMGPATEKCV